jgi:hypothetical protein
VGPRAVLDEVVKSKIPSPCWESNPRNVNVKISKTKYFFLVLHGCEIWVLTIRKEDRL